MRISGTTSTGPATPSRPGRAAVDGFEPDAAKGAEATAGPARAGAIGSLGALDMLLALQSAGGPFERRRRAVRRAERLLDGLDAVRMSLLGGDAANGGLERLRAAASEARESVDGAELDELLAAIDLRAAVELAKQARPRRSAAFVA